MPGSPLEPMPMSPRMGPMGNSAIQWARSRNGRMLLAGAAFFVIFLSYVGTRHTQTISTTYNTISISYHLPSWRPSLPHLPSIIHSPFKTSNVTLDLESGKISHVPSQLHKTTPNFHLLMPSLDDSPDFCKTTLSAAILNYPPPTIVNLFEKFASEADKELGTLSNILLYLENTKLVNDEDLLLIVDGKDTWFQLSSQVMIRQYQNILEDANKRLLDIYGDRFTQTIVFGAGKLCLGEDLGCRYVPNSILPLNIYGKNTGDSIELTAARYLDASMLIGPAKDLRALYAAAVQRFKEQKSQSATVQSVMSTILGEQQMARSAFKKAVKKPAKLKVLDWFDTSSAQPVVEDHETTNYTMQNGKQYEFSIGLDYTHTLFQPLAHCSEDELLPLPHDNSTDLSKYHHDDTPTPALTIPTALQLARPPFWTPDLSKNNPSPNERTSWIGGLDVDEKIDKLQHRDTPWSQLHLVQNTYTGAIPVSFRVDREHESSILMTDPTVPLPFSANVTWSSLWYAGYERALLRKYFRTPQSPIGYHAAAVGGDRQWDQRGGRGGVWTIKEELWLPFLEIDGVCGKLVQVNQVFNDGKGIWLHENDPDAEKWRQVEEEDYERKLQATKEKDAEREKKKILEEEEERERMSAEEKKKKDKEDEERKAKEKAKMEKAMPEKEEAYINGTKSETNWRTRR